MTIIIIASVGVLAFVALVVFLILTLRDTRRILKKTDRILNDAHQILDHLKDPIEHLLYSFNKLTLDIKKKSEGLDVLFRPLYGMRKENHEEKGEGDALPDIVEWITTTMRLFQKIKKQITE